MLDAEKKRKLAWHCRRGMLELDLLLGRFLEKRACQLSAEELHDFESLLNHTDPELFAWLMGKEAPQMELKHIVNLIRTQH